jgi:hypothetical protein
MITNVTAHGGLRAKTVRQILMTVKKKVFQIHVRTEEHVLISLQIINVSVS